MKDSANLIIAFRFLGIVDVIKNPSHASGVPCDFSDNQRMTTKSSRRNTYLNKVSFLGSRHDNEFEDDADGARDD